MFVTVCFSFWLHVSSFTTRVGSTLPLRWVILSWAAFVFPLILYTLPFGDFFMFSDKKVCLALAHGMAGGVHFP